MRLEHVLQRVPFTSNSVIGNIVRAMQEDVERESTGEVVWSKAAASAVGKATVKLLTTVRTKEEQLQH